MDKEFIAELVEKLENAKTAAEVSNILNMGDADVQKLTVDDLDGISGGGHYVNLPKGQKIWVSLVDQNYATGTDYYYDRAIILEQMAINGMPLEQIISMGSTLFGVSKVEVDQALRTGGPVYLANYVRNAKGM